MSDRRNPMSNALRSFMPHSSDWRIIPAVAREHGSSEDERERERGIQAAKRLGMPLREYLRSQIETRPNDAGLWFEFVWDADAQRINEAISLVERVLDLDAVATGPALELMGPFGEEHPHQAFECVLQELPRFPGKGASLRRVALRSPVIRHRLIALRALSTWRADQIPIEVRAAMHDCRDDPDGDVSEAARAVLAGEPIPEPDLDVEDAG
jgi:hypothetical protein